jgi:hypothetical protein
MIDLEIKVEKEYFSDVMPLPWDLSLDEWTSTAVKLLNVKHGISRHPIIFVKSGNYKFAIKETNEQMAEKEIIAYQKLHQKGIPALAPVGYIIRTDEPIIEKTFYGTQVIENKTGYVITIVAEKVLPDSLLYKKKFRLENRRKIWDAAIDLFVKLHTRGIYWGDASLANMLIQFKKERIPNLGKKTVLEAIMADTETVEFPRTMSRALREADLETFFDSMDWYLEDLRIAGITKDPIMVTEGKDYIRTQYEKLLAIQDKENEFEEITNLDVKNLLGEFSEVEYGDILLDHIEKHKWYLNQNSDKEIPFEDAAKDWYDNVFIPICDIFRQEKLVELFPGKTASDLYVEIMQHKYYLSQEAGKDVGFTTAMKDYCETFGEKPSSPSLMRIITRAVLKILGKREESLIELS